MSCPDPSSIEAFALGRAGAGTPALESHLDGCASCGELVAELARIYANSVELSASAPSLAYARTVAAGPPSPGLTAADLVVGATLGRYRILRPLGEGGMGAVFAAHDPALDREVALKVLHADAGSDPVERSARLAREARAMAKLDHPNVVSVFDVGVDEPSGRLFVAMELVRGATLSAWLKEAPRPRAEILASFHAAGAGLAAAHARGLVHRDVKPENILRGEDGRVRVTDFGLARAPAADVLVRLGDDGLRTHAGALVGTPAYMSPEQLSGAPADAASDQFSFAVSLFEALHGTRPFPGRTLGELRANVLAGRTVPLDRLEPWERSFFLRALATDPAARFPDLRAALAALDARAARRPRTALLALAGAGIAAAGVLALTLALGVGPFGGRGSPRGADAEDAARDGRAHRVVSADAREVLEELGEIEKALATFTPDLRPVLERADRAVARARTLDDARTLADALLVQARVLREAERPKRAADALEEATRVARAAFADRVVEEAATELVVVVGIDLGKVREAEPWVALAEAEAARNPDALRGARLAVAVGRLRLREGRAADALVRFEDAAKLYAEAPAPSAFDGTSAWTEEGAAMLRDRAYAKRALGRAADGLLDARKALALVDGNVVLRGGPGRASFAVAVANLALAAGDVDEAREVLAEVRATLEKFGRTGTLHVELADVEARVAAARADREEATRAMERALVGMLREDEPGGALAARDSTRRSRSSNAIDMASRIKGEQPEDASAITDTNDFAAARAAEGDEAAATAALLDAKRRAEESSVSVGGALGATLHNLALLALRRGDLAAARDHAAASLVALGREVGTDHARVGVVLALEARILEKLGSPDAPARAAAARAMLAARSVP